jgi:hypothetical protein
VSKRPPGLFLPLILAFNSKFLSRKHSFEYKSARVPRFALTLHSKLMFDSRLAIVPDVPGHLGEILRTGS